MVNFTFLILELILADQLADLPPYKWSQVVVKNGNSTFLLLKLILADHLAGLTPVESSHGQFYISTIRANTGRSLADLPFW